ncbi:hypothetical protein BD309DRAFT_994312 [Dichomitus squalens]|nr:hypothetical protein BD309DRAFT_994312 [Dichomitus squalens]
MISLDRLVLVLSITIEQKFFYHILDRTHCVIYNHNRTSEEHREFALIQHTAQPQDVKRSIQRTTYQEELLLDQPAAPTPQRQASIKLICQRMLDQIRRTNTAAIFHIPTQASLKYTILDELEHWVLRDDEYNADDELLLLINTEHELSEDNSLSPRPLDVLSLLTRIQDNASTWYDTTNHHPYLTLLSEQAHIQLVINTLHNLQQLISPLLSPIPISHDPEEHHRSSYFAA